MQRELWLKQCLEVPMLARITGSAATALSFVFICALIAGVLPF